MTRDESLTIVGMVISHWPVSREWSKEEMDVYARLIQDMDVEITTSTLARNAKTYKYRPTVPDLREMVRAEKKRLAPIVEPIERKPTPVPFWVKRWICARLLFQTFGKERDERRFMEQGDFGDLSREMMPEGAWNKEAEALTDGDVWKAWKGMSKT